MNKDAGYIVETRDGKIGRTYHKKQFVNGKCHVHMQTTPDNYSDNSALFDPKSLTIIGFIK